MPISNKIYPRTGDTQTVYLKNVITNPNIKIGDYNFDIDLSVWTHKVIEEKNRFYIGIKMPDGNYHSFHGVNKNGNVGTLLYVNGNEKGKYSNAPNCRTISDLTESFIKGVITLDDALNIVQNNRIVYAPDATMQAMLSDKNGRVLIIEPGLGFRLEQAKYSLITNYSVLSPEITKPYIVSGDDRFERADELLKSCNDSFSVGEAFQILKSVKQEGLWATRVSFVYSVNENKVYYIENNDFEALFEAAKGTLIEIPIFLGAFYGLRRSEALGLKWDAIDFQNNTITIRHTVTSCNLDGKHIQIAQDTTKTKSSMRTLPLVPAFKEKLLKLKEQQEEYRRVCGRCYNKKYLEYICVDEMGTLISPHYLTSSFPKLLEKNNLRHIRFHDLRHSCASLLLANGVPMKQIQEWLGHSDFSTTANVYAHLDYNSKLSSADAMVNGLSGALEAIS